MQNDKEYQEYLKAQQRQSDAPQPSDLHQYLDQVDSSKYQKEVNIDRLEPKQSEPAQKYSTKQPPQQQYPASKSTQLLVTPYTTTYQLSTQNYEYANNRSRQDIREIPRPNEHSKLNVANAFPDEPHNNVEPVKEITKPGSNHLRNRSQIATKAQDIIDRQTQLSRQVNGGAGLDQLDHNFAGRANYYGDQKLDSKNQVQEQEAHNPPNQGQLYGAKALKNLSNLKIY